MSPSPSVRIDTRVFASPLVRLAKMIPSVMWILCMLCQFYLQTPEAGLQGNLCFKPFGNFFILSSYPQHIGGPVAHLHLLLLTPLLYRAYIVAHEPFLFKLIRKFCL